MNYFKDGLLSPYIQENDICVIHISESVRFLLKIKPEEQLQTKFGVIKAMDLVGKHFGFSYNLKKGWVLLLRLTPELWTQMLPHRTQILYQTDISLILLQLDIKPGSIVVESGTGSGSLSHSILRACLPHGFLYTFDTNESRVQEASREFEEHGYSKNVKVECRNICQQGYGAQLEGKADACILDLPQTWDAIKHAHKVLKPNGARLCTFSPCIEQVKQNVSKMTEFNFKDIVTLECLLRPFKVQQRELRSWKQEIMLAEAAADYHRLNKLERDTKEKVKRTKISADQATKSSTSIPNSPPIVPFNPITLPRVSHFEARHISENVSHSGYLTFATKRL